jgi:hypothetical protein
VEDRWGFAPVRSQCQMVCRVGQFRDLAYAHCREDILQLVDKSNEARVVDVDCAGVDLPQCYAGHG